MGSQLSKVVKLEDTDTKKIYLGSPVLDIKNKCNYNCPVCKKSGKTPNMEGRFFIINDTQCMCNACESVFPKEKYYEKFLQ